MDFSLFYFANYSGEEESPRKYSLILDSARWADQNDFVRLWTPERHFHAFGGLSPNPSVIAAAVATITQRVQICSGSVVLPLHDPIRVAEEWAVVDNISNGRVGLGVASGWVPNDFVISDHQDDFERRHAVFATKTNLLRSLWRGEPHEVVNPKGERISIRTLPRPIQRELPVWITAAGNPATFKQAGTLGCNILTHLLGQSLDGLKGKVELYHDAWKAAGHPGRGHITLLMHTLVGNDDDEVHDIAREPMKRYLASSFNLASGNLESVPFLQDGGKIDTRQLTADMVDDVLEASFEKYFHMASLLGSHEKCLDMIDKLEAVGVDETACLIDFGVKEDIVMNALPNLNVLRLLANPRPLR